MVRPIIDTENSKPSLLTLFRFSAAALFIVSLTVMIVSIFSWSTLYLFAWQVELSAVNGVVHISFGEMPDADELIEPPEFYIARCEFPYLYLWHYEFRLTDPGFLAYVSLLPVVSALGVFLAWPKLRSLFLIRVFGSRPKNVHETHTS